MADIITPILSIVSVLCSCSANNRCCYLLDLQENKDALYTAMEELKDVRDDVKRRVDEAEKYPNEPMKCNQEVNGWLKRVQTIESEVGKILEKADQEIQGRCFGGYCPKNCWGAHKIGKLVIRKLPIVNDLRNKGSFGDVAYKLPARLVQEVQVDLTVGMESMFHKVWNLLAGDEVRIMGLYGCGGVGKTTLLKQINNEFLKTTTTNNNSHSFDVVILVAVSKEINISAIQKEIGQRLGLSLTEADKTNIFNALSKKNFVLLLDDIWDRVDLQSIGIPRLEDRKSKVIFTTRSETVCGLMDANEKFRVECLQWDEAWTLFQEKVGNEALNSHPKVSELAKVVAKKCGGLPLALITIGRAMFTKRTVQEWNNAITTLQRYASDIPGMGEEVLPLLKLSYDNLRNGIIKSCFLYCALFPEDHSIKKSKLIDYWIGEGLILLNEFNHMDEARNQGYDVIGNLKAACLLESGYNEEATVKMHDTVRALALWIRRDCGSRRDKMLDIEISDLMPDRWYNAERIYVRPIRYDVRKVPPPVNSPNLLTLLVCEWLPISVPQNFFEFTPLLRVLDLSCSEIETFPTSITELLELQYLNLSQTNIKVIPEELRKLVKLKYLDLWDMHLLEKIPSGVIRSLSELRVLNLYHCSGADYWDLEELYELKHLNDLAISIHTQQNLNKLLSSSNQSLQMCTRRLELFSSPPSSLLSTTTTFGVDGSSIKSVEKLGLLSNLEEISLHFLHEAEMDMQMGLWDENHYHHHLGSYFFQNLSIIEIRHCNAVKDLTRVGYVGNLKKLEVIDCNELEEISSKKMMNNNNNVKDIFKSLESLIVAMLPKLKSICRNALAFPCLKDILVVKCPELKKLPFDSASNVNNSLQKIVGGPKWWSELQWEEKDHHNNKLLKSKFLPYFHDRIDLD